MNILQFASQQSLAFKKYWFHLQIYLLIWEKVGISYQCPHKANILPWLSYAYKHCVALTVRVVTELLPSSL